MRVTSFAKLECVLSRLASLRLCDRLAWLGVIAVSLTACSSTATREVPPASWGQYRATLSGQDVVVAFFEDIRHVQQTRPDLCWAASLEQALVHQGVDTDQKRLAEEVFPKAGANVSQTMNMFSWQQVLELSQERLFNGSEVWVRMDIDGWSGGTPILSARTFVLKIARELNAFRIPLVGISTTESGHGHIITVIGFAKPSEVGAITNPADQIVGFLVYDPLIGEPQLFSTEELFRRFIALVYVTTHDSAAAAIAAQMSSTKNYP
jgi:hypothetical protein